MSSEEKIYSWEREDYLNIHDFIVRVQRTNRTGTTKEMQKVRTDCFGAWITEPAAFFPRRTRTGDGVLPFLHTFGSYLSEKKKTPYLFN